MTLTELRTKKETAHQLEGIVGGLVRSQTDENTPGHEVFAQALGSYVNSIDGTIPAEFYDSLNFSDILNEAKAYKQRTAQEYITSVEENYSEALGAVEGDNLKKLALRVKPYDETGDESHNEIAGKHKEVIELAQAYENQDVRYFIDMIQDDFIKERMTLLANRQGGVNALMGALQQKARQSQGEFLESFVDDEGNFNESKARDYVFVNTGDLDGGDKINAYLAVGEAVE